MFLHRQLLFLALWSMVLIDGKIFSKNFVRKFPVGFRFGAATAAYQVEGGWNEDGKTESMWDHLTHTNASAIKDRSNGDVAADSYHLYKRDVEIMRELGLDYYRFSLSWPRILPTGFPDKINRPGVQYYNNLIDEMLKYNIEPVVTIYHWDLPQKLQEMGGWTNPYIIDWYSDFARVAFKLFGHKVKKWITINEPYQVCYYGYSGQILAPLLDIKGVADYLCAKNVLLAHANAYHIYDKEFRLVQRGRIFISISAQFFSYELEEFREAAQEANDFNWAIYSHPIFSKTGDFPLSLKRKVAEKSAQQGFFRSRLPELSPEEIKFIRGTSDYFGLNHYYSNYVFRNESVKNLFDIPSTDDDLEAKIYDVKGWKIGESDYSKFVPQGFYYLLTKIRNDYDNPPVVIMENGFSSYGGLEDDERIMFFRHYLNAMLDAIDEGSDIRSYTAWSMIDNFEWLLGYTERFGLYEVNFTSPERTRTPRKSAFVYKQMLRTRELDWFYEPDTNVMTIDN